MIKKILVIVVLLGCAWWYWKERTTLSEAKILAYYDQVGEVIQAREPDGLCKLLAEDYQGSDSSSFGEGTGAERQFDKTQACSATREMFARFNGADNKVSSLLKLKYSYKVNSIKLSPDKKSALVEINYSLDAGGTLMQVNTHSLDSLIRKNGKTQMQQSKSETVIAVNNRFN